MARITKTTSNIYTTTSGLATATGVSSNAVDLDNVLGAMLAITFTPTSETGKKLEVYIRYGAANNSDSDYDIVSSVAAARSTLTKLADVIIPDSTTAAQKVTIPISPHYLAAKYMKVYLYNGLAGTLSGSSATLAMDITLVKPV